MPKKKTPDITETVLIDGAEYEVVTPQADLQSVPGLFSVQTSSQRGHLHHYLLQKAEGIEAAELIARMAKMTELRSIAEKMPTMQEIFLKVVREE